MKKLSLICVVCLLCGCLAGCGSSHQQNNHDSERISKLKSENSSLKAKKSSKHKSTKSSSKVSNSAATNSSSTQTYQGTQQSSANHVVRDKDGRIQNPDGSWGPIPSPYKEGTPGYNQWHASVAESIRSANNEPELQLGPEPRANNTNQ